MLVDIYKNRNTASKTYGQFYGRVFPRDGLNQSLGTVLDDHFLTVIRLKTIKLIDNQVVAKRRKMFMCSI